MSHGYQIREEIEITFRTLVHHTGEDGSIAIRVPGSHADDYLLQIDPTHNDLTITRTLPADGDAQPGDLWRDRDGVLWFAQQVNDYGDISAMLLPSVTDDDRRLDDIGGVHRKYGPLVRVYREGPAEQQLTAADLVGMTGDPVALITDLPEIGNTLPLRILDAVLDDDGDVILSWQIADGTRIGNRAVSATTPIRLVGGA